MLLAVCGFLTQKSLFDVWTLDNKGSCFKKEVSLWLFAVGDQVFSCLPWQNLRLCLSKVPEFLNLKLQSRHTKSAGSGSIVKLFIS